MENVFFSITSDDRKKESEFLAGAYLRVSKEDRLRGESDSISSQRKVIESFVQKQENIKLVKEWVDDGVSGIHFQRLGFQKMMQAVLRGEINCILVKDLSRFGRDYIECGYYLQYFFPQKGIRFIAIGENYDSQKGDFWERNLYLPIMNILNDSYCQDISKKVRMGLDSKRKEGAYIGAFCVFGYQKSVKNHNILEIDWEAADIIRKIYSWRINGYSAEKIAFFLNELALPSPMQYKKLQQSFYYTSFSKKEQLLWSPTAVRRILQNKMYIGVLQQGKTKKINYKLAFREKKAPDEWIEISKKELQIIPEAEYEKAQKSLKERKRK